jgi:hypothetical protein
MFVLGLQSTLSAQAANAGDIVKKCVAALGGEDAIKNFADFKGVGDMKAYFGSRELPGTVTIIRKGLKNRTEAEVKFGSQTMSMIQAYDGKDAWMSFRGNIVNQPALNSQSDADHTMALLVEASATFALGQGTEIDGKKAAAVDVTFKGKKTTFFIDQEDHLVREIVFKDTYFGQNNVKETMEKRIRLKDYKKAGAGLFPHTWTFYEKGQKRIFASFNTVTFGAEISADKFARPDQAPDLRVMEERLQ